MLNSAQAGRCLRCGATLSQGGVTGAPPGGRTMPIEGRTRIIGPGQADPGAGAGRGHLVAPRELDLGTLRAGDMARGKLRIANNGGALLTGTARVGPDAPWLRTLSDTVYCAAGAVEALEVQVDTAGLAAGRYVGAVLLETDGGRATVQVTVQVFRESLWPALAAGLVTAVTVLALAGLAFAATGNRLPFIAAPAPTATAVPTSTSSPQPTPSATLPPTGTAIPTATRPAVDTVAMATAAALQAQLAVAHATATAAALQAQLLVAQAHETATAVAMDVAATDTAVTANAANQAPGAMDERLAIKAAVNNFLLVRAKALNTGDVADLPGVATDRELTYLRGQIGVLQSRGEHTRISSIEAPVWDAIDLHGPGSADATLTKHEDEVAIRNATGLPDDRDPSYVGERFTLRNQRFGVTYHMVLIGGHWLVADHTVYYSGTPQPTPQPDLLPPPGTVPDTGAGTATAVPTVATPSGGLSVEDVVKLALPSVLRITGDIANNQQSTGTGFVIATSGGYAYVVTNDHVVNGAANILLSNGANASLPAIGVQEDSTDDLAVIKIAQPATPLAALTWGDSNSAQLGENVVAIGFALGLQGEPTVSNGILSALHRDVGQRWAYLQHTAPINHGNSGGPLLDLQGRVIGINTLLDENAQSVYFAIPASKAQKKVADLIGVMP